MLRRIANKLRSGLLGKSPRIAIYGASLSAQSVARATGKTVGYSDFLTEFLTGALRSANVQRYTYAGNRLSDGGLLRILDVAEAAPDICVLELLVQDGQRGRDATFHEIRFVYNQLLSAGVLPVTFLVALPLGTRFEQFTPTAEARKICKTYGLPILEVDPSVSGLEFNGVHTRAASGRWLAAQLGEFLSNLDLQQAREKARQAVGTNDQPRVFLNQLVAPGISRMRHLRFRVSPLAPPDPRIAFRILQSQIIGPHSPCIEVRLYRSNGEMLKHHHSVWDPFCHYSRESYVHLAGQFSTPDDSVELSVSVSDRDPDYSSCRRDVTQWPNAIDRWMQPNGPFTLISNAKAEIELLSADS